MLSGPLVKYVLTAALRDKLFLTLLVMVAVGTSMSMFLGSASVIEKLEFVVVFAGAGLRLIGVAGLILFVVFYTRRAFDTRDVDYLLSRPLSRASFIFSHAAAFSLLALIVAIPVIGAVMFITPTPLSGGTLLWSATLILEFVIMANAAFFFSMVLSSAVGSTMAVMAFYLLSRLMGEILGILHIGMSMPGNVVLESAMAIISLIVPRLDLMAQTSWLIYGADFKTLPLIVIQGLFYVPLLVTAALIDLVKRQF